MRLLKPALCAIVTAAVLSACSGGSSSTPTASNGTGYALTRSADGHHFIPHWTKRASLIPEGTHFDRMPHRGVRPLGPGVGGIYVSELFGDQIFEYSHRNTSNGPPNCEINGISYPNDIASDNQGNIIDPDGGTETIQVFTGKGACGPQIGSTSDSYGEPVDASSANAATGTIAVANIFDNNFEAGSVSLCTLSSGCTTNLTNSSLFLVGSVAVAKNGDCWASGIDGYGNPQLIWFQGCAGSGESVTGYTSYSFGGIDIDNKGNIAVIDSLGQTVTIYSGCNPACNVVAGPYQLQGFSIYGKFNRQAMTFVVADVEYGSVDVYKYHDGSLNYYFSFDNGLTGYDGVEGIAQSPRSKE
jgi:hypothetical protein